MTIWNHWQDDLFPFHILKLTSTLLHSLTFLRSSINHWLTKAWVITLQHFHVLPSFVSYIDLMRWQFYPDVHITSITIKICEGEVNLDVSLLWCLSQNNLRNMRLVITLLENWIFKNLMVRQQGRFHNFLNVLSNHLLPTIRCTNLSAVTIWNQWWWFLISKLSSTPLQSLTCLHPSINHWLAKVQVITL